jgi:hypothetical protein
MVLARQLTPADATGLRAPARRHNVAARLAEFGALAVVALAVLVPVYAFYPGLMNADSLTMYTGAVLPGPVMDWHSAFLVYLWRGLLRAGAGLPVVTALQSALYFFAFYWLLALIGLGIGARFAVLGLVLLVPPTMPWIATIEKTTFMSVVLCAAFVCSLRLEAGTRNRALLTGAIFVASLIGTWSRANGLIVFAPVMAYTAWYASRLAVSRITAGYLLACFLLLALGAPALAVHSSAVVRLYPQQATMDLDLLNLAIRTGQDLVPPGILAEPLAQVKAAMAPDPFQLGPLETKLRLITDPHEFYQLQSAWLSTLLKHPLIYLQYRFDLYRRYQCFDLSAVCMDSWHWYTGGIDQNPLGLASRKLGFVFGFYKALAGSILFHPFFYMLADLAVLLGAAAIRHRVVGVYALILLVYNLSNALLVPGVSVRMVVPLGLMLPFLLAGLYVPIPGTGRRPAATAQA